MAQTPQELEYNFRQSWTRSLENTSLPHRGADDFWANTKKRLTREIAENSAVGAVTIGMIATYVVNWAEASGIDLVRFEAPISIYVALIAKSVFDELRARTDNNETELESKSKDKKNKR